MMKLLSKLGIFTLLILLNSCNKNSPSEIQATNYDCSFVQNDNDMDGRIDDDERKIMNDCIENSFLVKSEIENSLIGEWELIGHGEGWLTFPSQPCAYIIITSDSLISEFINEQRDTIATHAWEIEEIIHSVSGASHFTLKTNAENQNGLFINQFCENYMFGDATPSDGNMYLYKKVK